MIVPTENTTDGLQMFYSLTRLDLTNNENMLFFVCSEAPNLKLVKLETCCRYSVILPSIVSVLWIVGTLISKNIKLSGCLQQNRFNLRPYNHNFHSPFKLTCYKYGPIPASCLFIFALFASYFNNKQKKYWLCGWDLNPGPQNGRHRQIY